MLENARKVMQYLTSGKSQLTCLIHGPVNSLERCKVLSDFVQIYYSSSSKKQNKYDNTKNYVKNEVNSMVQKALDHVIQENLYRKKSAKTDSNNYCENENPESGEDNPDLNGLDQFNLKEPTQFYVTLYIHMT